MTRIMRLMILLLATLVAGQLGMHTAAANNYVVALPENPTDQAALDAEKQLIEGLYQKLGPGDVLIAYEAGQSRQIARVDVPANPGINANRIVKAKAINSQFGKIWQWIDATNNAPPAPGQPERNGDVAPARLLAIDLPAVLDQLPGHTASIIIAGSALYSDPREPTFSMDGGFVPTDVHLLQNQDKSPYGTAGREKALQGATVHYCYTDPESVWVTDLFRQHVGRIWAAMVTLEGGRPSSFAEFDSGCINNFLNGVVTSETVTVDRSDKATMRKFERTTTRPVEEAANAAPATPPTTPEALFERPASTTAPTTFIGPMRIGIKWECPCDLDLYARSRPQSEWLYYNHRKPADGNGYFDHDFTSPPPGGDAYEYVQFNSVDIREVSARVNFYAGTQAGGPPFRLRIWFAGGTYDAPPMKISASSGNGGRSDPMDWVDVDVLAVTGLRSATHAANVPVR